MLKKWHASDHAKQRVVERLNIPEHQAEGYLNQLRVNAVYKGEEHSPKGRAKVYDHYKSGVRMLVSMDDITVITVKRLDTVKIDGNVLLVKEAPATLTVERITAAIKREYKRMRTEVTREINKMKEEYAATGVKIAELKWKQVRCKAPHTKELIQSRIDELVAVTRQITTEIDAKLTQMDAAEAEVKAVVGE